MALEYMVEALAKVEAEAEARAVQLGWVGCNLDNNGSVS